MARYDFMSFGEANIRMAPPSHDRLGQAEELHLGIAAAELNCCVNIARLSTKRLQPQLKTAYVTKLVDFWTGEYIMQRARAHGVDMSNVVVEDYDDVGRTRNGLSFIEVGIGPRPGRQLYDRGHSALSKIQPGDIDWESVLQTRWFHTTGIVTALGQYTASEVVAALKAAKKNGATTSYDLNYRYTLWDQKTAREAADRIMPYVDVILGNEEDFETMLGIDTGNTGRNFLTLDPENYRTIAQKVMKSYPHVSAVGTSLREVRSALLNNWQTVLMTANGYFVSRKYEDIEIYDRTGGGDSFASSLIWGLLEGRPEQEVIDFAGAYSALCHTVRNDWNLITADEAYELMSGGSARVKR